MTLWMLDEWCQKSHGGKSKKRGGGKEEWIKGYEVLKLWVFYVINKRLRVLQFSLFLNINLKLHVNLGLLGKKLDITSEHNLYGSKRSHCTLIIFLGSLVSFVDESIDAGVFSSTSELSSSAVHHSNEPDEVVCIETFLYGLLVFACVVFLHFPPKPPVREDFHSVFTEQFCIHSVSVLFLCLLIKA